MAKTVQQRLIDVFLATGWKEVGSKSSKYRVVMKRDNEFYLCGKAGSLRKNNRPIVAGSISLTHNVHPWLEKQEVEIWKRVGD